MLLHLSLVSLLLITGSVGRRQIPDKESACTPSKDLVSSPQVSVSQRQIPMKESDFIPSKDLVPSSLTRNISRYSVMLHLVCVNESTLSYKYQDSNTTHLIHCPQRERFCDPIKRACVAKRPLPPFKCPGVDDIFPMIGSCEGFVLCQNKTAFMFKCAYGQQYIHRYRKCLKWGSKYCQIFRCHGRHGSMVAHDADDRLYAICKEGDPISMNLCPPGLRFSVNKQHCVLACSGLGYFQDEENKQKYHFCIRETNSYKGFAISCPEKMVFNFKTLHCITDTKKGPTDVIVPPDEGVVVPSGDVSYEDY